ncbi:MAG TPA: PAS domain S-box protein [Bacteroidota bacterium]|nr:PAS domain S-box protein [Bacteroidota bacterium]
MTNSDLLSVGGLFRRPVYKDPEQNRRVQLLWNSTTVTVLGALINFMGGIFNALNVVRYVETLAAGLLLAGLTRILVVRVNLRVASAAVVIGGWILTFMLCITGGGLQSPIFLLFSVVSLAASVLIGRKALVVSMIATLVAALGLAYLDSAALLPHSRLVLTPYSLFFNFAAVLVLVWFLQLYVTNSLTSALDDARSEVASRKEAEEKVTRSQALLTSVLDSTLDVIVAVDEEMRVTAFNEAVRLRLKRYGSPAPYVGMPLMDMLPSYRIPSVMELGSKILSGEHAVLESSSPAPDGSTEYYEELYTPIKDDRGRVSGFTIFVRTITERKVAEMALATNEKRLRQIIDLVPHFIFAKDETGRFILVNRAIADAYGTTVDELTGRTDGDFNVSEEEVRRFRADDIAVIQAGVMKNIPEEQITDASGKVRFLNTQKIPFTFSGTSSPAILGVSVDITERKEAEELLRQTQTMLSQVLDSIPQSVFWKDLSGVFLGCNEGFAASTLLKVPASVVGKTDYDLSPSRELAEQYRADDREVVQSGRPKVHILEEFRTSEGITRWVDTTKVPLRNSAGEIFGVLGVNEDITIRKKAQEELALTQFSVDRASIGIVRAGLDGSIISVNDEFCQMLGYTSAELVTMNVSEVDLNSPPGRWAEHVEQLRQVGSMKSETIHRRKDGTTYSVEVLDSYIEYDGQGYCVGFVQDITDRKRAIESERVSRQRIALHVEQTPLAVIEWDEQLNIRGWNPAAERMFGYSAQEAIGRQYDFIVPETDRSQVARIAEVLTAEGGSQRTTNRNVTKDGRTIDCEWFNTALVNSSGEMIGVTSLVQDVTERTRTADALNQERNLLRTLIDSLPDSVYIYIKDAQSRYIINNLAHLRSLGVARQEDVTGKTSFDFFAREGAERFYADEQEIIRTGQPMIDREEIVYDNAIGEVRWHLTTKVPLTDASGKVVGLVGMSSDITERKRAEEALKESEARFRSLYDNSTVGLYRTTPDGRILMSNPAVVRMLGYSSFDELMQKNIEQDNFDPDYPRSGFRARLEQDGRIIGLESGWKRKDGTTIFVRESATVVRDEGGRVLYYDGVVEDITDRKRAEAELSEERERLAVTLRSIGDGVITTDLQGNVTLMNRVAEQLTGWPLDEAMGKPLNEVFCIIDEYSREVRKNPVQEVLETRGTIELANHTVLVTREGHEVIVADSGAPIFDKQSRIIGVVLVFRDTTEKQRLLDNLQRAEKLQSLGVLAGGLAHDFNNLLGGIFGYLELAQRHTGENEKLKRYIDKALTTFNRAKDLTQQLLTFSKGGAPNRKTGMIAPVLRENTLFALSGSNISAHFVFADDLWRCDFDENQIGQVIDNLVINAQQAMPLGGSITVSAKNVQLTAESSVPLPAGAYIEFSVTDSGTGIPPNILPRIFDPFFTTKQKGSGLGLTTVYSVIEKHEGTITVESKPDKGTTFRVYLPASDKEPVEVPSEAVTTQKGIGRILVMDDEESIRETTHDMLESLGYAVVSVQDGQEALRQYDLACHEGQPFDAVIMDLTIPGGMGGKEGIQKLREKHPGVMAFVSSGYSNDPVLANPTSYGFTDKIQKPFRLDELSELLHRYLTAPKV